MHWNQCICLSWTVFTDVNGNLGIETSSLLCWSTTKEPPSNLPPIQQANTTKQTRTRVLNTIRSWTTVLLGSSTRFYTPFNSSYYRAPMMLKKFQTPVFFRLHYKKFFLQKLSKFNFVCRFGFHRSDLDLNMFNLLAEFYILYKFLTNLI